MTARRYYGTAAPRSTGPHPEEPQPLPTGIFSGAQRMEIFERYACQRLFARVSMTLGWAPWRDFLPTDYHRHPPGCPDADWCAGNSVCYWRCTDDGEE